MEAAVCLLGMSVVVEAAVVADGLGEPEGEGENLSMLDRSTWRTGRVWDLEGTGGREGREGGREGREGGRDGREGGTGGREGGREAFY